MSLVTNEIVIVLKQVEGLKEIGESTVNKSTLSSSRENIEDIGDIIKSKDI